MVATPDDFLDGAQIVSTPTPRTGTVETFVCANFEPATRRRTLLRSRPQGAASSVRPAECVRAAAETGSGGDACRGERHERSTRRAEVPAPVAIVAASGVLLAGYLWFPMLVATGREGGR